MGRASITFSLRIMPLEKGALTIKQQVAADRLNMPAVGYLLSSLGVGSAFVPLDGLCVCVSVCVAFLSLLLTHCAHA